MSHGHSEKEDNDHPHQHSSVHLSSPILVPLSTSAAPIIPITALTIFTPMNVGIREIYSFKGEKIKINLNISINNININKRREGGDFPIQTPYIPFLL